MESSDGRVVDPYHEGYYERGEGSNYFGYGDDPGWLATLDVMRQYQQPARLHEFGCAKGYFVQHALEVGYDATGHDVSQYAIESCSPGSRGSVWQSDGIRQDGIATGSVNTVVSFEMLEHVPEDQIDAVLDEMYRETARGGWWWHRIALVGNGRDDEFYSDATHVLAWTEMQWRRRLSITGLVRVMLAESDLNRRFANRDWSGRFFVYRKPVGVGYG